MCLYCLWKKRRMSEVLGEEDRGGWQWVRSVYNCPQKEKVSANFWVRQQKAVKCGRGHSEFSMFECSQQKVYLHLKSHSLNLFVGSLLSWCNFFLASLYFFTCLFTAVPFISNPYALFLLFSHIDKWIVLLTSHFPSCVGECALISFTKFLVLCFYICC